MKSLTVTFLVGYFVFLQPASAQSPANACERRIQWQRGSGKNSPHYFAQIIHAYENFKIQYRKDWVIALHLLGRFERLSFPAEGPPYESALDKLFNRMRAKNKTELPQRNGKTLRTALKAPRFNPAAFAIEVFPDEVPLELSQAAGIEPADWHSFRLRYQKSRGAVFSDEDYEILPEIIFFQLNVIEFSLNFIKEMNTGGVPGTVLASLRNSPEFKSFEFFPIERNAKPFGYPVPPYTEKVFVESLLSPGPLLRESEFLKFIDEYVFFLRDYHLLSSGGLVYYSRKVREFLYE
jgi:hypothetical protein